MNFRRRHVSGRHQDSGEGHRLETRGSDLDVIASELHLREAYKTGRGCDSRVDGSSVRTGRYYGRVLYNRARRVEDRAGNRASTSLCGCNTIEHGRDEEDTYKASKCLDDSTRHETSPKDNCCVFGPR